MSDSELDNEIRGSADDLQAAGLSRPRFFAYPFGARSEAAENAVARAGYSAAFGPRQAKLSAYSPRFDLPRVQIFARDTGWRFRAKIAAPEACASWARLADAAARRWPVTRKAPIDGE
jgi:peptidoglycan/xylan/chitin deacetylase (PgdA/CDA1 family)